MNINDYLKMFNETLMNAKIEDTIDIDHLKYVAIQTIEKQYKVNYLTSDSISVSYPFSKLTTDGYEIKCKLKFIFKIQVGKTDKKEMISEKKFKYLRHLNGIRFVKSTISLKVNIFKFVSNKTIAASDWSGISPIDIKLKKNQEIKNFIEELDIDKFKIDTKQIVCFPFILKAEYEKDFADQHNYNQFIIGQHKYDFDKMYQYIFDKFEIKKRIK